MDIHHYYIDDNLKNRKIQIKKKTKVRFLPCKRIQKPDWLNVSSVVNVNRREFFSLNKDAPNGIVPDKDSEVDEDKKSLSCKLNERL